MNAKQTADQLSAMIAQHRLTTKCHTHHSLINIFNLLKPLHVRSPEILMEILTGIVNEDNVEGLVLLANPVVVRDLESRLSTLSEYQTTINMLRIVPEQLILQHDTHIYVSLEKVNNSTLTCVEHTPVMLIEYGAVLPAFTMTPLNLLPEN